MADDSKPTRVHVVGAGIAGMIAAFRLLEKGYRVTVYEQSDEVGGKFGAVKDGQGVYHEHAYHIFPDWCLNFFKLCEELGLSRDTDFEPFPDFHILRPLGAVGYQKGRRLEDFRTLRYLGSPEFFWTNVNSRVAPWQHMLLFGYSFLDMLTDLTLDREEFLNRVSVNGYVRSLPYASDMTALLHQDMLLKVFASPSYEISARTYQTYLRFTAGSTFPHPPFRALKGNVQIRFWGPFMKRLDKYVASGYFTLHPQRVLTAIEMADTRVQALHFQDYLGNFLGEERSAAVAEGEHVIVAIPPEKLYTVARQSPRLLTVMPELLDLGQLQSVRFAALDLYLTEALTLPSGHVTLMDNPSKLRTLNSQEAKNGIASEYGLSFIDNGRFWPADDWKKGDRGKHFLGVLVGDYGSLVELDQTLAENRVGKSDNAPGRIIRELQKYISFNLGDIDWERSFFRSQKDTPLFVNSVGSWEYRPETRLSRDDRYGRSFKRLEEKTANLHLAGDYCRSRIDVVSVEAALSTGITAARAICPAIDPALEPREPDLEQIAAAKKILAGWVDIAAARARTQDPGEDDA